MTLHIRPEQKSDEEAVFNINAAAFPTDAEAKLVNALREQADPLISLVAVLEGELVGHLMLSPVTLDDAPQLRLMGLAPMAVAIEQQNSGIGSALVNAGIQKCRELNIDAIVVLGHPEYYPRFGFQASTAFQISSEYDVPAEVFMAQELKANCLEPHRGTVRYHPVFSAL